MLKRILIPVDMSGCSLAALHYGAFLGEHSGAQLIVLHVAPSFDLAVDSAEQLGGSIEAGVGAAPIRDFLQDVQRNVIRKAHVEVICGDVSEAILRAAEQHGVDIIIMGSHGEGDTHGSIVGHVVKDVAKQAECAVVPVFEPAHGRGMFSLSAPVSARQAAEDADIAFADAADEEIHERPSAGALRNRAPDLQRAGRLPTH